MACCVPGRRQTAGLSRCGAGAGPWNFAGLWKDQADVTEVKSTVNLPPRTRPRPELNSTLASLQVFQKLPRTVQFDIYKRGSIPDQSRPRPMPEREAGLPDYYGLAGAAHLRLRRRLRGITIRRC